ncbi:MAG: hypothetical protein NTV34_02605, partial [Proteobacteria bacterium]|nr:hypothetical protein [Pseudomonadota bacterium]
ASAYYQAAALTRNPGRKASQRQTLERISDNFGQLVDIVAEAADVSLRLKPTEILGVYDRWNRTGSERLRHILLELGITPVSVPYKVAQ